MFKMKKLVLASLLLATLLSVPVTVNAMSEASTNQDNRKESSTESLRKRAQAKIDERVEQDKKKLSQKLNSNQEQRIKSKCKPAQELVANYTKRVDEFEKKRQEKYGKVSEKLDSLATKLAAAGRTEDATKVQEVKTGFESKVAEVYAAIDDFQQTLSDLSSVDCATDPTAFQAVLEAAREYRSTVNEKTKAVKTYYADTLVSTLSGVKTRLSTPLGGSN